ncbi:MAG TPA: hypothetical protein VK668_16270 [Mucilaginibacter sp.]|nr:hypothetical protein [Mucilaginibacter sp.]
MKTKLLLFTLIFFVTAAKGQNVINVTYTAGNPVGTKLVKTTTDAQVQTPAFALTNAIAVNVANAPAGTAVTATYNTTARNVGGASPAFTIAPLSAGEIASYTTYVITVTSGAETATYQSVGATPGVPVLPPVPPVPPTTTFPTTTAVQFLGSLFPTITSKDFGLTVQSSSIPNYPYIGDDYTHIFLDQFGNSLLGVIPQGISNRQYIVHVVYFANQNNPSQISYSINQTKGSFSSALVFNNAGQIGNFSVQGTVTPPPPTPVTYIWAHQEFPLRPSTDNIEFEVSRNILNNQSPVGLDPSMVAKRTIEMAKVFHGSFDIGLIKTDLANPIYELVPSVGDANQKVVKATNPGSKVVVTAMATFYTSPIILLEKYLFGMDIPNYKLTGRNFLDDHKIYERIFPALGVSLTDKAFKNIFIGLNWEIARGASVFAGVHYGEVNTFSTENNFKFEETVINEAEFNLRTNTKWKSAFAIGANLDLIVVTNLFKQK